MNARVTRHEFSSELVAAPRPISAIAGENLDRIDAALARLTACGVRIESDSRLHQAREIVAESARGAGITPTQRGDDLGLRALETALDYHTIASAAQPSFPASVRRELRDSLRGGLKPPDGALSPLQLQSQAVAFAAFALAGCSPRYPPKSTGKSPDILLDRGTMTYAVEAKRPQTQNNILTHCRAGYEQVIASGHTGAVLVDVTDCVRGLGQNEVHAFVERAGGELLDSVATEDGRRPEYQNLIAVGCYARVQAVAAETEKDAVLDLIMSARIAVLANVRNSLEDHRARWIRDSHKRGMIAIYDPIAVQRPPAAT
ncbi:MAG TPA: hypothetical protein VE967_08990 [Gemmatimonadaceae bacterium]|nr:hypothetical protein [Gemmatimonadaceae bacterium]